MSSPVSRHALARLLSIVGHPAVLMPFAVTWASVARQATLQAATAAVGATLFVAMAVALFSVVQVRSGRWRHVDASVPHERAQLNLFVALLLAGAAIASAASGHPASIWSCLALGAAIVVVAHLSRAWLKASQHTAFAALAVSLFWPDGGPVVVGVLLVVGIAWSRVTLGRHTVRDVVVGGLLGLVAGVAHQIVGA